MARRAGEAVDVALLREAGAEDGVEVWLLRRVVQRRSDQGRQVCLPRPRVAVEEELVRLVRVRKLLGRRLAHLRHHLRLADEAPERVASSQAVPAGGALGLGRRDQRGERVVGCVSEDDAEGVAELLRHLLRVVLGRAEQPLRLALAHLGVELLRRLRAPRRVEQLGAAKGRREHEERAAAVGIRRRLRRPRAAGRLAHKLGDQVAQLRRRRELGALHEQHRPQRRAPPQHLRRRVHEPRAAAGAAAVDAMLRRVVGQPRRRLRIWG